MAPTTESNVLIAILAAGASQRMGSPKLLLPFEDTNLLDHAIKTARNTSAADVCVISGAYHDSMVKLNLLNSEKLILNTAWETGQSTSVRAAVQHCRKLGYSTLLITLSDLPNINNTVLNRLIDALQEGSADAYRSVAPGYKGSPCAFKETCFSYLEKLTGDEGARQFFKTASHHGLRIEDVEFDDARYFVDIDTPQDYEELTRKQHMESTPCVISSSNSQKVPASRTVS